MHVHAASLLLEAAQLRESALPLRTTHPSACILLCEKAVLAGMKALGWQAGTPIHAESGTWLLSARIARDELPDREGLQASRGMALQALVTQATGVRPSEITVNDADTALSMADGILAATERRIEDLDRVTAVVIDDEAPSPT